MTGILRIFCDLEGVLVPEMWPHLARRLAIPALARALARTTRDMSDYRALMQQRLAILRAHGLTLADVMRGIADIRPYAGAVGFLRSLQRYGPVTGAYPSPATSMSSRRAFRDALPQRLRRGSVHPLC